MTKIDPANPDSPYYPRPVSGDPDQQPLQPPPVQMTAQEVLLEEQRVRELELGLGAASPVADPMLKYFACDHLPESLAAVSGRCCDMAYSMVALLPICAERTAGLRKLLEAKDCFVRAVLEGEMGS